ncbi:MAG: hypothetical protein ACRDQG_14110 [Pseudonocardiaceae bacterium]
MTEHYETAPNGHGEMALWRFRYPDDDQPVELFTRRELDRVDTDIWPLLVAGLVTVER